jgi:protein TonB
MTVTYPEHVFVAKTKSPTKSSLPAMGGLHPLRGSPRQYDGSRLTGGAVTVALHVLGGVLFYFGVSFVKAEAPPPVMDVSIIQKQVKQEAPVAPQVQMVRPEMPQFAAPVIEIAVPTPAAITVAPQAPTAPVAQPPVAAVTITSEDKNSYFAKLLGRLNRYKRYPASARAARRQGVVMLHFIMNANGQVLLAEINKTSGVVELDAEALALVRRAEPLPAIPAGFGKDTIDAVVPIEFFLR